MAAVKTGVHRDIGCVATGLETFVQSETGATRDRRRLDIPADASVDVARDPVDLATKEAKKPVR
jgi:hypothetical protein